MTRLDLIQFTSLNGRPCTEFGLQEVSSSGELIRLYDNEADQLGGFPTAKFSFVRTLGEIADADDFWTLVADAPEITPQEAA